MKKTFLVTFGIVALIIISYAFTSKHDEPKYKNLKILSKDITHEQMDSVMHHFAMSLNVKCNFCHIRNEETKEWNWPSDENKHKLMARNMMKMTNKINDKYFKVAGSAKNLSTALMVTCYTCHHGSTEPATKAPRMERTQQRPSSDSTKRN
ncbi:MAG: c-type cytochrome [Bacteroidota bacterium]|nr:c-type cytochrome [Bacteroidota bacterium]